MSEEVLNALLYGLDEIGIVTSEICSKRQLFIDLKKQYGIKEELTDC
jgi:hypothetical protein